MGAVFNISLPTSWAELSDKQLLMVYSLFARDLSAPEVKTLCLMKWNKLRVLYEQPSNTYYVKQKRKHFFLPPRGIRGGLLSSKQIQAATAELDFLDDIPNVPIRLSRIGHHRALPANFQGVPFEKYLYLENLFQGVLHTSSSYDEHTSTLLHSQTPSLLKDMSHILYNSAHITPSQAQLVSVFYWFASLKQHLASLYPHFFQPLNSQSSNLLAPQSLFMQLRDATNAQIRALTGGDITKEETILQMDTHRALTELDAKARDAEEYRKVAKS